MKTELHCFPVDDSRPENPMLKDLRNQYAFPTGDEEKMHNELIDLTIDHPAGFPDDYGRPREWRIYCDHDARNATSSVSLLGTAVLAHGTGAYDQTIVSRFFIPLPVDLIQAIRHSTGRCKYSVHLDQVKFMNQKADPAEKNILGFLQDMKEPGDNF